MIVDFFVVGAARSGTTSLYNYLSRHPNIFLPKVKECNFFSDIESLDHEVYEVPKLDKQYHMKIINSYEVYKSLFKDVSDNTLKGEVSPSYLWDKTVAKKIYDHNPNAKIIISLRNPIKRAFSHYLMNYNTGYEKEKCFESAIKSKKTIIWGGGNQYLEMSLYYDQVKPYYEVFDKKNIKILIYEDWIINTENCINEVYSFLNVQTIEDFKIDRRYNETIPIKNIGVINFFRQKKIKTALNKVLSEDLKDKIKKDFFGVKGEKEKIKKETYNNLKNYFNSDVIKLEELLNIPFSEKWDLKDD